MRLTAGIELRGDRTVRMSSEEVGARRRGGGEMAEMICGSPWLCCESVCVCVCWGLWGWLKIGFCKNLGECVGAVTAVGVCV